MSEIEVVFGIMFVMGIGLFFLSLLLIWSVRPLDKEWRVLYYPGGKTKFIDMRTSIPMYKSVALSYMEILDDAVCIEKIRGRGKGKKIYKKRLK